MDMPTDLQYIAMVLHEWPDNPDVAFVRLDWDGEICFEVDSAGAEWTVGYDFYPIGSQLMGRSKQHPCFIGRREARKPSNMLGTPYTKQSWEEAHAEVHNE